MYKKKIEQYIEAHKQEMLDDICTLCSINSERSAYQEGDPFGEGPSRALAQALKMAEEYGFSINNYDNYVGTADLNDGEHQLDILAHLDVVPAGEGWTVTQPFEPIVKDGKDVYKRQCMTVPQRRSQLSQQQWADRRRSHLMSSR